MFLCQYHTVLMTIALQYSLKPGRLILPVSFFFSRLFWLFKVFYVSIQMLKFFCIRSVKNAIGNLIGFVLNLQIALGSTVILTILILPIQEHGISFHLFVSSLISFHQHLIVFRVQVFLSPQVGLFLDILFLFDVMVNGNVSLIYLSDFFCSMVQKCNIFLCFNFIDCNLTKFIDEVQQFSKSICKIFYLWYHVICTNNLTSSFTI